MLKKITSVLLGLIIIFLLGYAGFLKTKIWFTSKQKVVLIAQDSYAGGATGAVRLFIQNEEDLSPVENANVTLTLYKDNGDKVQNLFAGQTDQTGSLGQSFTLPSLSEGPYNIKAIVDSKLGHDTVSKSFVIKNKPRLLLTTDRTLYKPGQIIQWRTLAVNQNDFKPLSNKTVTASIYDGDKNLIFKKDFQTSAYGITGDTFPLASELNTGDFKLALQVDDTIEEKMLTVRPFQLPKFTVSIDTDKSYYKPDENIKATVKATYFFGEPVKNGQVILKIGVDRFGPEKTNDDGVYIFNIKPSDLHSPESSINPPPPSPKTKPSSSSHPISPTSPILPSPISSLLLTAEITDPSQNLVTSEKTVPVSSEILHLELIPEGGTLKPNLDNEIFILATYPDGTPAKVTMRLSGAKNGDLATNEFGVTSFIFKPTNKVSPKPINFDGQMKPILPRSSSDSASFTITSVDKNTPSIKKDFFLAVEAQNRPYLLLHPDQVILDNPKNLNLQIQSTTQTGTVFIDVVQNGQFISTLSTNLTEGAGNLTVPLNDSHFGTIELLGYQRIEKNGRYIGKKDGQPLYAKDYDTIRDSKLVYVNAKKGLNVKTSLDKTEYKPGGQATVSLNITDEDGQPANSAIGLKVVDEAMLALEKNSTDEFEKMYLLLEKSLQNNVALVETGLKPVSTTGQINETQQLIARQIFAKTPTLTTNFSVQEQTHASDKIELLGKFDLVKNLLSLLIFIILGLLLIKTLNRSIRLSTESLKTNPARAIGQIIGLHLSALVVASIIALNGSEYLNVNKPVKAFFRAVGKIYEKSYANWDWLTNSWYYYLLILGLFLLTLIVFKTTEDQSKKIVKKSWLILLLLTLVNLLFGQTKTYSSLYDLVLLANKLVPVFILLITALLFKTTNQKYGYWLTIGLLTGLSFFALGSTLSLTILTITINILAVGHHDDDMAAIEKLIAEKIKAGKKTDGDLENYFLLNKLLELKKKRYYLHRGKKLVTFSALGIIIILFLFSLNNTVLQSGSSGYEYESNFSSCPNCDGGGGGMISAGDSPQNIMDATGNESGFSSFSEMLALPSYAPAQKQIAENKPFDLGLKKESPTTGQKEVRVRKLFPEVMYFNPAVIAENGQASVKLDLKDSITTWRLSALASSLNGNIGSSATPLKVFQDFFIDFDLPGQLTVGDEIELPVTLFNYTDATLDLKLEVKADSGLAVISGQEISEKLSAKSQSVVSIKIKAVTPGQGNLNIKAVSDSASDAIVKQTTINPDGKIIKTVVASQKLGQSTEEQIIFPSETIPGTAKIILKLYPSYFSQIIEGLDAILRFPSGCFEQISSSLYPDILVLNYLQKTNQASPEITKKALEHIKAGWQKILTYQVKDTPGGFSLYGNSPAEVVLTAYGLMEFQDLQKVYTIDPDLLKNMEKFLYDKQKPDGSFNLEGGHQGGLSRSDELSKNAYIIWALSHQNPTDARLQKSLQYLKRNLPSSYEDSYTLSLMANALINGLPNDNDTKQALDELKRQAQPDGDTIFWKMKSPNYYGSYGLTGNLETTALAAMTLLKSGGINQELGFKALNYLIAKKDPNGSWHSTQATILALKALLTATEVAENKNKEGEIKVTLNDKESSTLKITKDNNLVVQLASWDKNIDVQNKIKLSESGDLSVIYEIVKSYAVPWDKTTLAKDAELSIDQSYTFTVANGKTFAANDIVSGFTEIKNTGRQTKNSLLVRLPIPAGFVAENNTGRIKRNPIINIQLSTPKAKKVELYEDSILVYLQSVNPGETIKFNYGLQTKYPSTVKVLPAVVYDYYNPFDEALSQPAEFTTK